jgi:ribosomal protein L37E
MTTSGDMTTCPRCGHRNPAWQAACTECGGGLSLASSDFSQKKKAMQGKPRVKEPPKMSVVAHVLCGWPLVLVGFGGAIGGALGAAAYAINVSIYKAKMPAVLKILMNLVVGASAIAIWYFIAAAIRK